MIPDEERTYLGFDFSTQQLKGIVVNDNLEILHEAHVQFDSDLPEFRTHNGVVRASDKKTVTSPVLMWVKALDMILDRLRVCGADFSKVAALSGSAQQHGTVYWSTGSEEVLKALDDSQFLHTQLASCFSITSSPVWLDSSTRRQCVTLEKAVGGAQNLAAITGSKAYERYSAAQISKIFETKQGAYRNTERISLISSFACSLFLGKYAPIDWSDASGMNLFDIQLKTWSQPCLEACAEDLGGKLGEAVPSQTVLGKISEYFVERFGFDEECRVVAFTGDNPSSLAGMCLKPTDLAISLGTSDTLFCWLSKPVPLIEGHNLINPIDESKYMALLCFKNGSITRERIKDTCADKSWDEFSRLLESTPRGNFGYMGLFYDENEIIPQIQGDYRFDKAGNGITKFPSPEVEIRALLEGQFLARKAHMMDLGLEVGNNSHIIATGGGSRNKAILQVLADVFNAPVHSFDSGNSAVIGAAYRAKHALTKDAESNEDLSFSSLVESVAGPRLICEPFGDAQQIYGPMLERYRHLISQLLNSMQS